MFGGLCSPLCVCLSCVAHASNAAPAPPLQGQLQHASVTINTAPLHTLLEAARGVADCAVTVTRELAVAELRGLSTADLAAAILEHVAGPAAILLRCLQALCARADKGRGAGSVPHEGALPALARVLQVKREVRLALLRACTRIFFFLPPPLTRLVGAVE